MLKLTSRQDTHPNKAFRRNRVPLHRASRAFHRSRASIRSKDCLAIFIRASCSMGDCCCRRILHGTTWAARQESQSYECLTELLCELHSCYKSDGTSSPHAFAELQSPRESIARLSGSSGGEGRTIHAARGAQE